MLIYDFSFVYCRYINFVDFLLFIIERQKDSRDVYEEINQALALKLDLKTTQKANEKALASIITSRGSATDLRQALQARAAIYENLLSPA